MAVDLKSLINNLNDLVDKGVIELASESFASLINNRQIDELSDFSMKDIVLKYNELSLTIYSAIYSINLYKITFIIYINKSPVPIGRYVYILNLDLKFIDEYCEILRNPQIDSSI